MRHMLTFQAILDDILKSDSALETVLDIFKKTLLSICNNSLNILYHF